MIRSIQVFFAVLFSLGFLSPHHVESDPWARLGVLVTAALFAAAAAYPHKFDER